MNARPRIVSVSTKWFGAALAVLTLLGVAAFAMRTAAAEKQPYRSPFDLAFSPEGKRLAVSDRTAGRLYVLDAPAGEKAAEIALAGKPMGVVWLTEDRVLVAEYDAGTVAEVDVQKGQVLRRLAVGPKPVGVAVATKKGLLVVSDYGLHQAVVVDLKTGRERFRSPCGKHPYFVAVTPGEEMAVVGNLISAGPANDPASAAVISLIDLDSGRNVKNIPLLAGCSNVRQVRVSGDGRWAYVVHTQGRTTLPTTQVDRGWISTNALTIIDLTARELYATALLDTIHEGAADPWGIALAADGKTAWISIAGAQQIARIELAKLHEFLAGRGDLKSLGPYDTSSGPVSIWQGIQQDAGKRQELAYHLSALYAAGLMTRVNIAAQCPRGIAVSGDGRQLAVASYYSGEVLLLDSDRGQVQKTIGLGPQPKPDEVRHGEFVFHNGRHCFQHWLSCSTCHPDGRADGLNWDLINDGIGNPKNARSLLWSHQTPPVMSLGVRESMEEAVQKGFQFIQFREVDAGDLDAVRAYLRAMEPEASPYLVQGRLSKKALKGKHLFEDAKVGCAHCHAAPLFTSLETHDVGTKGELDSAGRFDTPTCVELWRTGPYLHDGRAVTLQEMLTTMNPENKHGKTSHLSEEEVDALVEYLLSL